MDWFDLDGGRMNECIFKRDVQGTEAATALNNFNVSATVV